MKAADVAVDLEVAAGGSIIVSLRPDGLESVGAGKMGGKTYSILVTLPDGSLARLHGGSRLWSVLAPFQRAADAGKPVRLKIGKTGEGTATAWTAVGA